MVVDLRKKQAHAIRELKEQVAVFQKGKAKLEKDVHCLNAELVDSNEQLEESQKLKVRPRKLSEGCRLGY